MMKELERYLGATYINSYQTDIMNKTTLTFPNPWIPTTITDIGVQHPKTDVEMAYLEKKNTEEAIHQKLRKKDVYETDIHNI